MYIRFSTLKVGFRSVISAHCPEKVKYLLQQWQFNANKMLYAITGIDNINGAHKT